MSIDPTIHPVVPPSTSTDEVGSASKSLKDRPLAGKPLSSAFVRSELVLHWLFFSMAAVVLVLSFLMKSDGEKAVFLPGSQTALPESCAMQRLVGIDCPGCGMTRAFIAISSGQFARAWNFNPVSFVLYLFVALQIPWHIIQIWRLKNRRHPLVTRWAYMAPAAMEVVLTVHWLWNIASQFGS